ncbi:aryl-alcohol-oxidase from pleurotus Eryingii [Mycena leptocephala]|nr:aryl-alcohol-oxidase from pleurotus Eryingii [Mycena leptocephala]
MSISLTFVLKIEPISGGTAGNVVASRLTENPSVSVLVLEAGPSNKGVLDAQVPADYTTTPQTGANGHVFDYLRGYLLGGCSSHNGMDTRGAAEDFDRYANLTEDEGWSWNRIFPYFLKNEKWTAPADDHNTQGQFNPAVHGTHGPISVSLSGFPWPEFEQRVVQTTDEIPDDFSFNLDMNSGQPLGIAKSGWLQYTIGHGERSSSATGYLTPGIIQRPNLDVLLHAQVSKLNRGSHRLEALGILTLLDLPTVGKNASEHAYSGVSWAVNSNQTVESITQNTTRFNEAFAEWDRSRTGPFVDPSPGTHAGWLRLNADSPVFDVHADPSPGPGAPHFEMLFQVSIGVGGTPGHFISLTVAMVSPVSRGSVTLSSSEPFAAPVIDLGLLSSEFDALALTEGIKLVLKFASAPAWNGYLGAPTVDLAAMSPAELTAHIRANSGPGYHIVGTAGMSPRGAQYGVVDPDLKVKGIHLIAGLRVIDASVLPIVPGAHTQAATYVVAERGADMVKQSWTL